MVLQVWRNGARSARWRRRATIEDQSRTRVDVLDVDAHFVTSADCAIGGSTTEGAWSGALTAVEPHAHLGSGRYRIRWRDGVEAVVHIQARQRIGREERYPFVGEGPAPHSYTE